MRSQLIALGTGSVACLAYGITRGLGYGLPPYSVIYAAAVGVIAGLLVYRLFAIKTRWLFRLSAAAVVLAVLGFGAIAYAYSQRIPLFQTAATARPPALSLLALPHCRDCQRYPERPRPSAYRRHPAQSVKCWRPVDR